MTIRGVLAVLCATAAAGAAMKIETSDEHKSEEHEELNAELSRLVRAPSPLGVDGVVPSEFGAQNNGVQNHNRSPQGALGGGNGNTTSNSLNCDFDFATCEIRSSGPPWHKHNTKGARGNVLLVNVPAGQSTVIAFQQVIQPPAGGIICLSFSYMRYEKQGDQVVPLVASLQPVSGRGEAYDFPITTSIPGKMRPAHMNLTDTALKQPVQLYFNVEVPASAQGQVTVAAVDDIKVTEGKC